MVWLFAPDLTKYFNSLWKCICYNKHVLILYIFNWYFIKSTKDDLVLHVWAHTSHHCWFAVLGKFSRFCISQLEDTRTNIDLLLELWKETERERGMWLKKSMGLRDSSCWAGNQTEPSPLARHSPQTRVTQPGSSLVVRCAEWDLIKMQVSPLWDTVRHSQEDWRPTVFYCLSKHF